MNEGSGGCAGTEEQTGRAALCSSSLCVQVGRKQEQRCCSGRGGLMTGEAWRRRGVDGGVCVTERSGDPSAPLGPGGRNSLGNSHGSNPDH